MNVNGQGNKKKFTKSNVQQYVRVAMHNYEDIVLFRQDLYIKRLNKNCHGQLRAIRKG